MAPPPKVEVGERLAGKSMRQYVKSWASDAAANQRSGRLQQPLSRRECALGCPPPANEPVRHRPWRVATDCSAIAIDYTENAKIEDAAEGGGSDAEA